MNLLQVATTLKPNGIANVAKGVAQVWPTDSSFAVMDADGGEAWTPHGLFGKMKVMKVFPGPSRRSLEKYMLQQKVGAVLCHFPPLDGIAYEAARRLKLPVYYYYHNVTAQEWVRDDIKAIRQQEDEHMLSLLEKVDGIFCNSNYTADKVWQKIRRRAVVASPCVDVQKFKPSERLQNNKEIDRPFRVLTLGRIEPHKGVEEFLQMMIELMDRYPRLHLDCIGRAVPGDYSKRCEVLMQHERIIWHQGLDDAAVVKVMQQADLFASASHFEGFGMPFLEAAACGLPSVGYQVTAIPEAVSEGVSGHLVTEGDHEAFKKVIKSFMSDRGSTHQMGLRARQYACHQTWEKTAQTILEVMKA